MLRRDPTPARRPAAVRAQLSAVPDAPIPLLFLKNSIVPKNRRLTASH
jgi:hypothetical protein